MSSLSKAVQGYLAQWIRGTSFPAPPTTLYIGLSTTVPKDNGTSFTEPTLAQGYTRQIVVLGAPVHVEGVGTTVTNTNALVFGPAATSNWPTVVAAGVFDQSGNLLFKGEFTVPRSAPIGDSLSFGVGTITFRVV